ncbi:Rne/Rng family ribonuclease [Leptolyngbya sp. FACHB-711]|uniref:Rne/Rng family ribonuclease n=1 Tax=unclassified Leptolyngbya TaxID=2650499 RepID=UPI001683A869|nr:Rne/Rng family ribonuclease [Leptolyngbya sp. FACHB-711]MBD1853528.1 Rne/Rng family ribonuclease [Cyanobacteria bacterium FACHB-502]MBD2027184.1 Rne/Rng family ribonuclease [Leptolyngbya sp. FACHB-711]
MSKQIVIAEQHRIAAVFSEDQIQELIVAKGTHQVGDIYLGVVENVLPGIDAAFVNIGDSERNGFIHVSDLGPLRLRKAAGSITELLAPQQKVLVQIMKEPTGNKGPRLTGNISLPGRYLVLMPFGRGVNLSRRIRNEAERNRLRALAILIKPAGMGLLVRTEAEGMPEEAILEDLEALQKQWESIQQEALSSRPPCLLNRDDDFIQRVLRDVYSADVNRIVVDSHTGLKRVKQHLTNWNGGRSPQGILIDHHRERTSILEYFRVNAAIREALKPRVDLPSGGYIIIERTEALTVIDVNSGSFTRSATARETVLWTNSEAATEIARQLRLRNIAGVIIVDFIDMDSRRDQLQVLEQFNKALRADKARPQIAQLSELGLVELTRKRQGQNIYELFGRTCSQCGGLGHTVHLPGETEVALSDPLDPVRIPATAESRPVARDTWERSADDSDLDPAADLQELNLTNHPDYRERSRSDRGDRNDRNDRGDRGDNRRRRRGGRVKVGEPTLKPTVGRVEPELDLEPAPLEEVIATPILNSRDSRDGRENRDSRENRESRENRDSRDSRDGRENRDSRENRENRGVRERDNRSEKLDRSRVSRRERPLAEPPQVISVEMTPEEQDVYALMGISPLVLSTETVKDLKSTVVAVTLPGQRVRQDPASLREVSLPEQPTIPEAVAPPAEQVSADLDELPAVPEASVSEVESNGYTAESAESDEGGYSDLSLDSTRRRRRRRSSLVATDDPSSDVG